MKNKKDKSIKIIIVDDNITFRKTIIRFLQNEFHFSIIGEASSGEEFFALSNFSSADVILMDLQMPGMDGYNITKKFLADRPNVPVIAITMHAENAYLKELICVGFKGCVFKPDIYKNIHDAIVDTISNKYYFPKEIKI